MASSNAPEERPPGRRWGKSIRRLSRGPLCCPCLRGEREDPLRGRDTDIRGGHPPRSGENEVTRITAEDLGIDNITFSLFDEDPPLPRRSTARSASSVSACPRALKKTRLKSLSSLPLRRRAKPAAVGTGRHGGGDEGEDDPFLFDTDIMAAPGGLLTLPAINLIPPTPSDVTEDDQFFDVNSEESAPQTSGSDGSSAAGDRESCEENVERAEVEEPTEGSSQAESTEGAAEPEEGLCDQSGVEGEAVPTREWDEERVKPRSLRSICPVAPLPEFTQKNDLINRDVSCPDKLKEGLCLLPHGTNMDAFGHQRGLINRPRSAENALTRSATFHALTRTSDHQGESASPKLRRTTIASYSPQSRDQNGNFPEKDVDRQAVKPLGKLSTDEVCQWFTNVGLQKCLPHIREAKLCGADIASVNVNTLDLLHVTTLEDRERLLSAIYDELHPPTAVSQRLDSLLESLGPNNVETFTTALASMSRSKSSPHVSCLSMNRRSLMLRSNSQNNMGQRNSQLIEITINASERIVHLRTPKETTMGKIIDSCVKMLGVTGDKSLFILKETQGSSEELPPDRQIGSLLKSDNRQLELHLCKTAKLSGAVPQDDPEISSSEQNSDVDKDVEADQKAKEERIRELKEQVDSLQNAILQVQELHHDLVAFCSELKNMDGDEFIVDSLGPAELTQRLESVKRRQNDKRQRLQALGDEINNFTAHKNKQLDVRTLEKIKLNCQVFKEEISMLHLNRQLADLQNALQESHAKKRSLAIGSLSRLVSPRSPATLLVVQENRNSDGNYGFTCLDREGSGLVVARVDGSHLCVGDRLVEVNGASVVGSTPAELTDILRRGPAAQIAVLRQPAPAHPSRRRPLPPRPAVNPDPTPTVLPERDAVATDTPPQRKVIAI